MLKLLVADASEAFSDALCDALRDDFDVITCDNGYDVIPLLHEFSPDLFLLDEPFSALDFQTRIEVSEDIASIIKKSGKTIILITHDLQEAICLSDRILVLSNRPAHVLKEVPVHLTCEGSGILAKRAAPEFNDYFNEIWEDLCDEN